MEELMLFMEDFDNAELSDYEWEEQLQDAVKTFNTQKGTSHHPAKSLNIYRDWKRANDPNRTEPKN